MIQSNQTRHTTDDLILSTSKKSIETLTTTIGFQRFEQGAVSLLSDLTLNFMLKVCQKTQLLNDHVGSRDTGIEDVLYSLNDFKITIPEINRYVYKTLPILPPINLPLFPVNIDHFHQKSQDQLTEKEKHVRKINDIPDFLPPICPKEKCKPKRVSTKKKSLHNSKPSCVIGSTKPQMSSPSSSSSLTTNRNLIIYIEYHDKFAAIISYNVETKLIRHESIVPFNTFEILHALRSSPSIELKHVKAIVFILSESLFLTFSSAYNFRQKCYDFCEKNGIFYLYIPPNIILSSMALLHTQTIINEGEEVLILSLTPKRRLNGTRIIRQGCRYRITDEPQTHIIPNYFDQYWKLTVMGYLQPRKIILIRQINTDPPGLIDLVWRYFLQDKVIVLTPTSSMWISSIIDTVTHKMGEKINQYIVATQCTNDFAVCNGTVELFTCKSLQPFEKSAIIEVDNDRKEYVSLIAKASSPPAFDELLQDIPLSTFTTKKIKVTLKIDSNGFYDFQVEEIIEENVEEKRMYFVSFDNNDKQQQDKCTKPPTIRFTQDDYYFVLENCVNDAEKLPIYISFAEKKPTFGKAALEVYSSKPECVVYDIIKLCSQSSLIFVNPKWNFSLSKSNDNSSSMVTVQTADGQKQASPDFLLALVLKDAINKIQQRTYTSKVDELQIGFDGFMPNKFLKKSFQDAGKRLKIEIIFC